MRRLGQARIGIIGLGMVGFMLALAFFAPFISPRDPLEQDLQARLRPPFWDEKNDPQYKLGTDQVGRDMLSRLIYGSRISLSIGFLTMAFSALVGITLGILAGYYRGSYRFHHQQLGKYYDVLPLYPSGHFGDGCGRSGIWKFNHGPGSDRMARLYPPGEG